MKKFNIFIFISTFGVIFFKQILTHPAELDGLIKSWRHFRYELFNILYESVENTENYKLLRQKNKVQKFIRNKIPCPLNNTKSSVIPDSVHKLRPGDIDVIIGIGDSLTAGVGLLATNFMHVPLEHRGIAPTAGGKGSWRRFITLPNILKTFNPNLAGYATETSMTLQSESNLNLAETGAVSEDMPYMTEQAIKRITASPNIDIHNSWKMVSFMIGPNDFCSQICFENDHEKILAKHRKELIEVLRLLKNNLPRTFVNLIPPPNLRLLLEMTEKSTMCQMQHLLECPCLFGPLSNNKQEIYVKLMEQWQNIDIEIGNDSEFDTDNFTVVIQPFTLNFTLINTAKGTTDYTYFSEDCFHLSQKGNARIANSLWNNILEPVDKKSKNPIENFPSIKCPTENHPYLFTRKNSVL